jgi:hypothetical protein
LVIGVLLSEVCCIVDLLEGCVLEVEGDNCSVGFGVVEGVNFNEFGSLKGVMNDDSSC